MDTKETAETAPSAAPTIPEPEDPVPSVPFFAYVKIAAGQFAFNYTHNRMHRGCMWLHVVAYGPNRSMPSMCGRWRTERVLAALRTAKRQGHSMYRPATVRKAVPSSNTGWRHCVARRDVQDKQ